MTVARCREPSPQAVPTGGATGSEGYAVGSNAQAPRVAPHDSHGGYQFSPSWLEWSQAAHDFKTSASLEVRRPFHRWRPFGQFSILKVRAATPDELPTAEPLKAHISAAASKLRCLCNVPIHTSAICLQQVCTHVDTRVCTQARALQ